MSAGQPAGLDDRITDAFSVLSLLIAVVAAYLAAVWPIVADLLNSATPDVDDDSEALANRCDAYNWVAWGLTIAAVLVAAIMLPLVVDVFGAIDPGDGFSTLRASVLLFFLFMLGAVASAFVLGFRLRRRAKELRGTA